MNRDGLQKIPTKLKCVSVTEYCGLYFSLTVIFKVLTKYLNYCSNKTIQGQLIQLILYLLTAKYSNI